MSCDELPDLLHDPGLSPGERIREREQDGHRAARAVRNPHRSCCIQGKAGYVL